MASWNHDDLENTNIDNLYEKFDNEDSNDDSKLNIEILKYLNEADIGPKKSSIKKQPKQKVVFLKNEKVKVNNSYGVILYGPYELNNKRFYEIEMDIGNIVPIEEKHIQKIK